jgi:LacI family transcriptional regulator
VKAAKRVKSDSQRVVRDVAGTRARRSFQSRARKTSSAPVRLADVARYAGVSTASVSRAINAPELVSLELRQRVQHAAQVLNWVPNGAAKALASLQSRTIGAVIPTLGHQNFATLIEALQQELAQANYTLVLGCVESSAQDLRVQLARKMVERGVDCLVLVGEAQPAPLFELLKTQRIPYVITYTSGKLAGNNCIGFDNYSAAARITRHLLDLGHRQFAMIAASPEGNDRIQQRIAGTKDTLAQAGLGIRPQHFAEVDSSRRVESGRAALRQILMQGEERPTALVCSNDYIATGALIEAAAMKVDVPRDLSVTGFDDIDLSAHLVPALTTVRVPAREMGEEIARYVIRLLDKGSAELPRPLEADLVVRDSTAPPRQR